MKNKDEIAVNFYGANPSDIQLMRSGMEKLSAKKWLLSPIWPLEWQCTHQRTI